MKKHSAISNQRSAKSWLIFAVWVVISCLATPFCAFAFDGNNLEQELRAKYQGQVVMLRNFYCGKELQFDAQGNLIGYAESGAWTLCRDVKVEELKVRDNKLRITGHRVYLRYDASQKQFLDVTLYEKDKHSKRYKDLLDRQKMVIEAQLPSAADSAVMQVLLDKVFYKSEQEFLNSPPQLWRTFFHAQKEPEDRLSDGETIERVGKNVKAPRPVYSPDPDYDDESRLVKYQGTNALNTVIDVNGRAVRLQVVLPLGMGLDEQAAAKISSWKFNPAKKDGQPVPVEVTVEVSFNLY